VGGVKPKSFMPKSEIALTEAEWAVIKAVWQKEPCTAPDIQGVLEKSTGWTYSTVRTLMDRMVVKGVLKAVKAGKMTLYRSVATREQAQRGELLYALKHAFNGALTPMVQCLLDTGELSEDELTKLESLIKARKRKAKR
jgi:predicted transcriptional regulator